MEFLTHLVLIEANYFIDYKLIVAEIHIAFIDTNLTQAKGIIIGCERIGYKSLVFEYEICDEFTGKVLSISETIKVTFDYHKQRSIVVPEEWHEASSNLEDFDFRKCV